MFSPSMPFVFDKSGISFVILFFTLTIFTAGSTSLAYPLLIFIIAIWIRSFLLKEILLLISFFYILLMLSILNVSIIGNYVDLTSKAFYKLSLFTLSALAYKKFIISAFREHLTELRVTIWISFAATLLIKAGFDLKSMQQMMIITILFVVEFVAFIRGESRIVFYAAAFVLLITTKKQLLFTAFIIIALIQPKLIKKFLLLVVVAVLFIFLFGVAGAKNSGTTTEQRLSSSFSERFITPDPYGNMRLYLVFTLIPKLIEHDIVFGYGLERYGTTAAYETKRDVERSKLGLSDFIGKEYNPNSRFGSVAADVGFLTIMMQAGLVGLLLYLLIFWMLALNISKMVKGGLIVLPYFFGGPIVYSIGLPILLGVAFAVICTDDKKSNSGFNNTSKHYYYKPAIAS